MRLKFEHLPLVALGLSLIWIAIAYRIAIKLGHITTEWPYFCSIGVYPPERYLFLLSGIIYTTSITICHWIWFIGMRKELQDMGASLIAQILAFLTASVMTMAQITVLGFVVFDMESVNRLHYHSSLASTVFHVTGTILGFLLTLIWFRSRPFYYLSRLYLCWQMIIGTIIFMMYNQLALLKFRGHSLLKRTIADGGYDEWSYSTMGEALILTGGLSTSLVLAYELKQFNVRWPFLTRNRLCNLKYKKVMWA